MVFSKFFKPKWQHKNPEVRLQAIGRATDKDEESLVALLSGDDDQRVRLAALDKLDRLEALQEVFGLLGDDQVRTLVGEKIQTLLLDRVLKVQDQDQVMVDLDGLNDQSLGQVACQVEDKDLRLAAVAKMTSQSCLAEVLMGNCGKEPGLAALARLDDSELLEKAAAKASNKAVRSLAKEKLETLCGQRPDQKETARQQQIKKMLGRAAELLQLPDPETARQRFVELEMEWQKLQVVDSDPAAKEFLEASQGVNKRWQTYTDHQHQLAEKKSTYQSQIHALAGICDDLLALLASPVETDDQAVNQASVEFKAILADLQGKKPGELVLFFEEISRDWAESRRIIGLEQELLERFSAELAEISLDWQLKDPNKVISQATNLEKQVQTASLKYLGRDDLQTAITDLLAKGAEEKKLRAENLEAEKLANLAERQKLIVEVESLATAEDVSVAAKRLDEIRALWEKPQPLPEEHELEEGFKKALDLFHEHQHQVLKKKDWQLWANKNLKEELLVSMEELDSRNDLHQVFGRIRELQTKWKEIGPLPAKQGNKLWQRFKDAGDRNFQRCQEFFQQLSQEAAANLEQKLELIKEAEAHRESEQWKKSSEALKELQDRWKNIGRAPKDQEERIFQEFRQVCNAFFDRRKAHYDEMDRQRQENLQKKEELCCQAEELVESPKLEDGARVRELQELWKKCGAGPREKEQEIWLRFRGICDRYYQWLDTLRPENLVQKEELCVKAEQALGSVAEDRSNLSKVHRDIVALQRQWKTIGPAPVEKQDEIWLRFRTTCDSFFTLQKAHYAEIDKQRPENEARKREILEQAGKLVGQEGREAVAEIIKLQEAWKEIGEAGRDHDRALNQRMKDICNGFFQDRRKNFEEMDRLRRENQKKKEELCLRLELLAGVQPKTTRKPNAKSVLTLAEQLKLAFESNFATSGSDGRQKKDEIDQIRKEWKTIGEVPREHEHSLKRRFNAALDAGLGKKGKTNS